MREDGSVLDFYDIIVPFTIDSVSLESAQAAGLAKGDRVIAVGETPVLDFLQGRELLAEYKGRDAEVAVVRNGCDTVRLNVPINNEAQMGVTIEFIPKRTENYSFFASIPAGIKRGAEELVGYWEQLKMIVNPETKGYKEVGGFIAIGSIFPDTWNWQSFWALTAFISIALAIMNILPIPGLDGGHALFTLWEIITRRKPSDKFLEIMQYIGLGLLLILLVYANGNDILKLFID